MKQKHKYCCYKVPPSVTSAWLLGETTKPFYQLCFVENCCMIIINLIFFPPQKYVFSLDFMQQIIQVRSRHSHQRPSGTSSKRVCKRGNKNLVRTGKVHQNSFSRLLHHKQRCCSSCSSLERCRIKSVRCRKALFKGDSVTIKMTVLQEWVLEVTTSRPSSLYIVPKHPVSGSKYGNLSTVHL